MPRNRTEWAVWLLIALAWLALLAWLWSGAQCSTATPC